MGDYEETKVSYEVGDAKAKKKALDKLNASYTDITKMHTLYILWHLVVRGKKLWFWLALVGVGYCLGFLRVGL